MPYNKPLDDKAKKEIKEKIAQAMHDNSFGDGLEEDMIWEGWSFKGLNNMSDDELLQEYEYCGAGDEDEEDDGENEEDSE